MTAKSDGRTAKVRRPTSNYLTRGLFTTQWQSHCYRPGVWHSGVLRGTLKAATDSVEGLIAMHHQCRMIFYTQKTHPNINGGSATFEEELCIAQWSASGRQTYRDPICDKIEGFSY